MIGKIRQKLIVIESIKPSIDSTLICPICDRKIPNAQKDAHHLIPKSKGGRATQYLHKICHRQIHALFTETELAVHLNTAIALKNHPDMEKFIKWVKSKPDSFYERTSKSLRLKKSN
jgi:hypothetical protein